MNGGASIGAAPQADEQPVVVVVDAHLDTCVLLGVTLRREQMEVVAAHSLAEATPLIAELEPDVVIIDTTLPDGDGLALVQELRQRLPDGGPFVIAISHGASEGERLLGFEAGVDDFVAKPFSPQEVAFRVRAMLRRSAARLRAKVVTPAAVPAPEEERIVIGNLSITPAAREVIVGTEHVALTLVEYEILLALMENPRLVLTRAQLIDRIWGANWDGDRHALDVHVSNLRRKLSPVRRDQTFVRSVRGVGYRLGPCQDEPELVSAG